jgi:hypothetical protein
LNLSKEEKNWEQTQVKLLFVSKPWRYHNISLIMERKKFWKTWWREGEEEGVRKKREEGGNSLAKT